MYEEHDVVLREEQERITADADTSPVTTGKNPSYFSQYGSAEVSYIPNPAPPDGIIAGFMVHRLMETGLLNREDEVSQEAFDEAYEADVENIVLRVLMERGELWTPTLV